MHDITEDDDPNWEDINGAMNVLEFWGCKIGRIGGQLKEKYGTIRWYANLNAMYSLHDLVLYGHMYFRWSPSDHFFMSWLNNLSKGYMWPIAYFTYKYRCFMYAFAYYRACKRFPNIRNTILCAADYKELMFKNERKYD